MIELRKTLPALQQGKIEFSGTGRNGILSYTRTLGVQQIQIALNFSSRKQKFSSLSENGKLLFSTHRNVAGDGILYPFEGMVLDVR
jgi:hypothetical protein